MCDFFREKHKKYINPLPKDVETEGAMELPHKPEWASCLMETVKIYDLMRYCPLMEKDKKKIRKQTREPMEKYQKTFTSG